MTRLTKTALLSFVFSLTLAGCSMGKKAETTPAPEVASPAPAAAAKVEDEACPYAKEKAAGAEHSCTKGEACTGKGSCSGKEGCCGKDHSCGAKAEAGSCGKDAKKDCGGAAKKDCGGSCGGQAKAVKK